jgi:hypothetical protein
MLIAQDANWRETYLNGGWPTSQAIGAGTLTLTVVNPSGPLNNSPTDPVILTGIGVKGVAQQRVQVTLEPSAAPLNCLGVSMLSGSAMSMTSATIQANSQIVASNAGMVATLAHLWGNAEAVLTVAGATYHGTTTGSVAPRQLPDAHVFDYYVSQGTAINILDLPYTSSYQIVNRVLSPSSNPFPGGTNAQGIYVIDCKGLGLTIANSRIVGTLVLLNATSTCIVQASANWTPAVSNYPCLLVQGTLLQIMCGNTPLAEATTGANYNPPGTPYPYPGGAWNTTTTDQFPSVIRGLVYTSGKVSTSNAPTAGILLAAGTVNCAQTLNLLYEPNIFANPPPGFRAGPMTVQPGSWKQAIN